MIASVKLSARIDNSCIPIQMPHFASRLALPATFGYVTSNLATVLATCNIIDALLMQDVSSSDGSQTFYSALHT